MIILTTNLTFYNLATRRNLAWCESHSGFNFSSRRRFVGSLEWRALSGNCTISISIFWKYLRFCINWNPASLLVGTSCEAFGRRLTWTTVDCIFYASGCRGFSDALGWFTLEGRLSTNQRRRLFWEQNEEQEKSIHKWITHTTVRLILPILEFKITNSCKGA